MSVIEQRLPLNRDVSEAGFQLEFRKGRFPLRFVLLSYGVTAIALIFYYAGPDSPTPSYGHIFSVLIFVGLFCILSLGLLATLHNLIMSMPPGHGFALALASVVFVAAVLLSGLLFLDTVETFEISIFKSSYLGLSLGFALVGLSLILAPLLFWFEKRIYADKAAIIASELEQFANLDFRIRPHFLFNSLNSVAGLINQNPNRAETALYNLADVFRAVMADKRQLVPLKAELDMAEKYLYLEKIRLGDRLEVSSVVDPNSVGIKVPVFLLQPLLENAVYHGIETRFKGGKISLNIRVKNDQLTIKITNPLPESGVKRKTGNKVAQQNLRQRIIATFGDKASLDSYEAETSFNVVVRMPL